MAQEGHKQAFLYQCKEITERNQIKLYKEVQNKFID